MNYNRCSKFGAEFLADQLPLEFGYIKTDEEMKTAIDGAIATVNAAKYIEKL